MSTPDFYTSMEIIAAILAVAVCSWLIVMLIQELAG